MRTARNFESDLKASNTPEIRKSWEKIFKIKFGEDCTINWKDNISIQKEMGTDTTVTTKNGRRFSVELKTRKHGCNDNYLMEIKSHIYDKPGEGKKFLYSKTGWIYTTTAEYIFHATLNEKGDGITKVILYSLTPFKDKIYKSEFSKYEYFGLSTDYKNGNWQWTINCLIPKNIIKRDANEFWEWEAVK